MSLRKGTASRVNGIALVAVSSLPRLILGMFLYASNMAHPLRSATSTQAPVRLLNISQAMHADD